MPQGRKLFERQLSGDIDTFKQELTGRHSDRIEEVKEEGKVQGSQNLPPNDQQPLPPYQGQIQAMYQQDLADIRLAFGQTLQTIFADFTKEDRDLNRSAEIWKNEESEKLQVLEEQTEKERESEEQAYRGKYKQINNVLDNDITGPYNLMKSKLEAVRRKLGRAGLDTWLNSSWWYYSFLALIGLSEFPLNSLVFSDLGLPRNETMLLSGTLVIAIPLAAHFGGIGLKRRNEKENGRVNLAIFALCFVVILALTYFIGEQRELYMTRMTTQPSPEGIEASKMIMVALSLLLYVMALLLSYGYHDSSQEMRDIEDKFRKAQAEYDKRHPPKLQEKNELIKQHEDQKAEMERNYLASQQAIRNRKLNCEERTLDLRASYDAELNALQALEEQVCAKYQDGVRNYQSSNVQVRDNHELPVCFTRELPDLVRYFAGLEELDVNPRKLDS